MLRILTITALTCAFTLTTSVTNTYAQDTSGQTQTIDNRSGVTKLFDHLKADSKLLFGVPKTDPTRPYLNEAKIPHNNQWDNDNWSPEDWIADKGSTEAVIDGFYDAQIITKQRDSRNIPILEVGQPFLDLSPRDQRHVVEFVDYAYKITDKSPHSIFYIQLDDKRDTMLGIYSKTGLQMQ